MCQALYLPETYSVSSKIIILVIINTFWGYSQRAIDQSPSASTFSFIAKKITSVISGGRLDSDHKFSNLEGIAELR